MRLTGRRPGATPVRFDAGSADSATLLTTMLGSQRTLRADDDVQSAGHDRGRAEAEFAELGVLAVSPFRPAGSGASIPSRTM